MEGNDGSEGGIQDFMVFGIWDIVVDTGRR